MSESVLYSSKYYDNIWDPYLSYTKYLIKTQPLGLRSFLRACRLLGRYEGLLHDKRVRELPDLDNIDWPKAIAAYESESIYAPAFFDFRQFWFSTKGWRNFWSSFSQSYIMNYNYHKPRTFIDLGCGIGTTLFELYADTLDDRSRYYGLERSAVGLECAQELVKLLGAETQTPFFHFFNRDILEIDQSMLDCVGQDSVIFSISSLNKVEMLPESFFSILKSSLINSARVDIVLIETVGWQIYLESELVEFYGNLGRKIQGFDPADSARFQQQKIKNQSARSNSNLMKIIAHAVESNEISICNIFLNYFSRNPVDPYSAIHIRLNQGDQKKS